MTNPMKIAWVPTGICIPGDPDTSSSMITCAGSSAVVTAYVTASCSGKISNTKSIALKSCAKNDDDVNVGYVAMDTCVPPAPPVLQLSVKQVL